MATSSSQLPIAELDYDQILQNLITFMKADPTFSDYDFSGSGLNLIARVLAYVTFYNSHYLSAATNESFLDTAQLRSSVVSHARMLGYQAHGRTSATYAANVVVLMDTNSPITVTLPRNTKFELTSNTALTFYNPESVSLTQNTANTVLYHASSVELVEGSPATYRFVVDTNNPTQRFIIPNANVDFNHFSVRVQDVASSEANTMFIRATELITPTATDPIYLVQETYNGYPEFKFGNGIVGKPLVNGNVVTVDYYLSRGQAGNNVRGPFRVVGTPIPSMVRGVTTSPDANTTPSNGGSNAEDVEAVRFLAPLTYGTQNRCVTADDYKTLLLSQHGTDIATLNVFGGEQGDPYDPQERPTFGRVYIAIKPTTGRVLSEKTASDIIRYTITPRNVLGVIPQIVDPEYLYILVRTRVLYNQSLTTRRRAELATAVVDNITTYSTQALEKFDAAFRFSRLTRVIDDTDPAIQSSITRIELQRRIFPRVNINNTIVVKFGVPLAKNKEQLTINTQDSAITVTTKEKLVTPSTYTESAILKPSSHRFGYTAADGTMYTNCWLREANGIVQVMNTEAATKYTFTATLRNGKVIDKKSYIVDAGDTLPEKIITTTISDLYTRNPGSIVNQQPTEEIIRRESIVNDNVGTLNTTTGMMTLSNFIPTSIENNADDIWITVVPAQTDLTPKLNRLFTIERDTVAVEVVEQSDTASTTAFFQGGLLR